MQEVLKIALLGVPDSGKADLASALAGALRASGAPAMVLPIDSPVPATGLASLDLVLLMGLETGIMARPVQETEAADQRIRATLDHACIPYRVIYGRGEERLHQALQACGDLLTYCPQPAEYKRTGNIATRQQTRQWAWMCDKCSDPACEHRLLSDLLASRPAKG